MKTHPGGSAFLLSNNYIYLSNMRIAYEVTPKVFEARSLEEKSEVLTKGIYHLLSEKCGVVNSPGRKSHVH